MLFQGHAFGERTPLRPSTLERRKHEWAVFLCYAVFFKECSSNLGSTTYTCVSGVEHLPAGPGTNVPQDWCSAGAMALGGLSDLRYNKPVLHFRWGKLTCCIRIRARGRRAWAHGSMVTEETVEYMPRVYTRNLPQGKPSPRYFDHHTRSEHYLILLS